MVTRGSWFSILLLFLLDFNYGFSNDIETLMEEETNYIYSLLDTNLDSAFQLSTELFKKADKTGFTYHKANSLYIQAWILKEKKQGGESFLKYMKSLSLLKGIESQGENESGLYLMLLNSTAMLLYEHLETSQAIEYLNEALDIAKIHYNQKRLWRLNKSLAEIYEHEEPIESALNHINNSIKAAILLSDDEKYFMSLNKKGLILTKMNRYSEARDIFLSLVELSEKNNEIGPFYKGIALHNIGCAFFQAGDVKQAIEYYVQASSLGSLNESSYSKFEASKDLCEAYLRVDNIDQALHYGLKADSIYAQVNLIPENYRLFQFLSDIYFDMGEYEKSHYFTNRHFDENKKFLANQEEIRRIKNTYSMQPLAAGFLLSLQENNKDSKYLLLLKIISILFTLTLLGGICYQYFVRKSISNSIIGIEKNSSA